MLDEQLREQGFPTTWDNTMRLQFRQCPRKWYWFQRRFVREITPAYFVWGIAWGHCMKAWYELRPDDPADPDYMLRALLAASRAEKYWKAQGCENNGDNKLESFRPIMEHYARFYKNEDFTTIKHGAEQGWVWPIENSDYMLGGALDLYANSDRGIIGVEDKTHGGYISDGHLLGYSFSSQVTGYVWYIKQLHGSDEGYGVLVNVVTKKIPGPRSNWTTPRVARTWQTRTPQQLFDYRESFLWDIENFKHCWDNWFFPAAPSDTRMCGGDLGLAPCEYKRLCQQDGNYRDVDPTKLGLIELDTPWAPWERSGDDE